MQILDRFIVPSLGVVIILATFILDVLLVYRVLVGILGLAAISTYFAPRPVQVETRIAIAAVGLIILLIVSSTAFWLTLVSFAAIAAFQLPHRQTLRRNPATFAWLGTVLKAAQTRRFGRAASGGDAAKGTGSVAAAGDSKGRLQMPSAIHSLPGFVRVNVAGISGLVAGVLVLICVFMPWYGFLASAYGELVAGENLSLWAGASELGLPALRAFFFILLLLGVLTMISIGLPRAVGAIIAAVGFVVTLASYFYVFAEVEREAAELRSIGVGVITIPSAGCLITAVALLVMFVLQLIPRANRRRTTGGAG